MVPSYLAKGLEFDAVLVCCHGPNNYMLEEERNLFYTVCSRALHELKVLYVEEPPLFFGIDVIRFGQVPYDTEYGMKMGYTLVE